MWKCANIRWSLLSFSFYLLSSENMEITRSTILYSTASGVVNSGAIYFCLGRQPQGQEERSTKSANGATDVSPWVKPRQKMKKSVSNFHEDGFERCEFFYSKELFKNRNEVLGRLAAEDKVHSEMKVHVFPVARNRKLFCIPI